MTELKPGDPAPPFELPTDGGGTARLSDYAGGWLVLYFYPKDDTPGCTNEAVAFTQALPQIAAAGAQVLGVSKDPPKKHDRFKAKYGLGFPLVSDEGGAMVEAYGAWVEKSLYGRQYMGIDRSTFLIDPSGVVRKVWRKVKVPGHIESVLEAVKAHGAPS
ncbi:MAG TPA: peroxiredoxin [Caulobacteraceae bacterium]|jgi:peroxiredoxin Q/BCP|nr:peroxiredoxin [Caulobacteraceae bacterium]